LAPTGVAAPAGLLRAPAEGLASTGGNGPMAGLTRTGVSQGSRAAVPRLPHVAALAALRPQAPARVDRARAQHQGLFEVGHSQRLPRAPRLTYLSYVLAQLDDVVVLQE